MLSKITVMLASLSTVLLFSAAKVALASAPSTPKPAVPASAGKPSETVLIHFPLKPVGRLNLAHSFIDAFAVTRCRYDKTFLAQGDIVMQRVPMYRLKLSFNGSEDLSFLKSAGPLIRELDLNDFPIDDDQAKIFKYLPNLVSLVADRTDISDEGVKQLLCLKKLVFLSLSRTDITGKGLPLLSQMTQLKVLHVTHNNLDNDSLANLAKLHNLASLRLSATRIGDEGVAHLQNLTKLVELHLDRNEKITNKGIACLKNLKELRDLDLGDTSVTELCVSSLKNFRNLNSLSISYRLFGSDGLKNLRQALPGVAITDYTNGKVPLELFEPLHSPIDPSLAKPPH